MELAKQADKNVADNLDEVLKDYSSVFERQPEVPAASVRVKAEADDADTERRREDEDIPLSKKIKKFRPKRGSKRLSTFTFVDVSAQHLLKMIAVNVFFSGTLNFNLVSGS